MIECKIIHATPKDSSKGSIRSSENYNKRRKFLLENTIPALGSMNIEVSFLDAIMYPDLIFDRAFESKNFIPKKQITHNDKQFLIDNPFPSAYEIALFIGHFSIWEYSLKTNKSILILEDDALIKNECKQNILTTIKDFLSITNPALLYLQTTDPCDVNPKTKVKEYPENKLQKFNNLFKVNNNHCDWSGTAAYLINPECAKKLIERSNNIGVKCSDGFIHRAISENFMDVYIPYKYREGIFLHPEYS